MALAHGVDYSRPLGLQQPCGREAMQFLVGFASLVPSVPRVVLVRVTSLAEKGACGGICVASGSEYWSCDAAEPYLKSARALP